MPNCSDISVRVDRPNIFTFPLCPIDMHCDVLSLSALDQCSSHNEQDRVKVRLILKEKKTLGKNTVGEIDCDIN